MKWVTRGVNRIACPWLITRFVDKEPTFLFRQSAGGGEGRECHPV